MSDVRYVNKALLHCNLFSLATSAVNIRGNITLPFSNKISTQPSYMLLHLTLQQTIAFHTVESLLNQKKYQNKIKRGAPPS